ncbi:hypothetical protein C0989_008393 [Termitomyces sp. Mn162]|nr:hypothetical protein C0989_008393 [Termitomyces sp. Mn162]
MEVKGKEELKAVPAMVEEDKEEERAEEVKGTWSDMPLRQVGDDELEWLGEDLGWLTPLMSAALLANVDERVVGVEQRFQRKLEAAKEELLVAQAHYTVIKQTLATLVGYRHDCQAKEELLVAQARYTVIKQTLATLVGYRHDCQAFLAWQEENNVRERDWEKVEESMEVPDDDTDLDS